MLGQSRRRIVLGSCTLKMNAKQTLQNNIPQNATHFIEMTEFLKIKTINKSYFATIFFGYHCKFCNPIEVYTYLFWLYFKIVVSYRKDKLSQSNY